MPIAGSPMVQPEASPAPPTNEAGAPPQATFESPIEKAQKALNIALKKISESHLAATDKQKKQGTSQGNVIFLGGLWDLCPGKPEPQDGPINPPFPRSLRKDQHRPVHPMSPLA